MKKWFPYIIFCGFIVTAFAEVELPALVSDHAIIARRADARIFGYAAPGEKVTVSMAGKTASAITTKDGSWSVTLDLSKAVSGPYELKVNDKLIKDVLTGEVWLASGQSNMQYQLRAVAGLYPDEIKNSTDNELRFFQVATTNRSVPQRKIDGRWFISSPSTSGNCSAVAYFFAKRLRRELKVPVAVLNSAVGGSPIEAWFSPAAIAESKILQNHQKNLQRLIKDYP